MSQFDREHSGCSVRVRVYGRISPMIAQIQAAGAEQVLLCTTGTGGHVLTTPLAKQIDEATDVYTFRFDQLGVTEGLQTLRRSTNEPFQRCLPDNAPPDTVSVIDIGNADPISGF